MTNINHTRPELRLKDNMRRELVKNLALADVSAENILWPAYLRPVAANPLALQALFALLGALSDWLDDEVNLFPTSPPRYVNDALKNFGNFRIPAPFDTRRTALEWLLDIPEGGYIQGDVRPFLSALVSNCI